MSSPERRFPAVPLAVLLAAVLGGCESGGPGPDDTSTDSGPSDAGPGDDGGAPPDAASDEDAGDDRTCEALSDPGCFEIDRGEARLFRWIADYPTFEFDDEGTARTVIHLGELVDDEVVPDPESWRYQVYGTDGYTFGGFATWENIRNGYLEVGSRRLVFEPSQELPRAYRVRDAYLMVLTPGS